MGSEQNDGTSYQPTEPKLCVNNCGFFGSAGTENLCSKCYKESRIKEEQAASAKAAMEKSIQFKTLKGLQMAQRMEKLSREYPRILTARHRLLQLLEICMVVAVDMDGIDLRQQSFAEISPFLSISYRSKVFLQIFFSSAGRRHILMKLSELVGGTLPLCRRRNPPVAFLSKVYGIPEYLIHTKHQG